MTKRSARLVKGSALGACIVVLLIWGDQYPLLLEKVVTVTGYTPPARLIASKYNGPIYCTHRTSDDYAREALQQLAVDRPDIVATLTRDSNLTIAYSAISVAGGTEDKRYVPELLRHGRSKDPYERTMALYALAQIGDPSARPLFEQAYRSGETNEITAIGGTGLILLGIKINPRNLTQISDNFDKNHPKNLDLALCEDAAWDLSYVGTAVNGDASLRDLLSSKIDHDMMLNRLGRCIDLSNALRRRDRNRA